MNRNQKGPIEMRFSHSIDSCGQFFKKNQLLQCPPEMRLTPPIPSLLMPPKGQSYALFNAATAAAVNTRGGPAIKQCGLLVKHFSAMAM